MGEREEAPARAGVASAEGMLTTHVVPRQINYFYVSAEEIDSYSTWGWLFTVCLTICGIASSGALTCWFATMEEGLPPTYLAKLTTAELLLWAAAVVFLLGAGGFFYLQRKTKQRFFSQQEIPQLD